MPNPEETEDQATAHAVGTQSAFEAFPGTLWGGFVAGAIYYATQWTSHPMDPATAAGIAGGLVALGSMLSSYWMGRKRGVK